MYDVAPRASIDPANQVSHPPRHRGAFHTLAERERGAPDLLPRGIAKSAPEILLEARHKIEFRDHQVDRKLDIEPLANLVEPPPDIPDVLVEVGLRAGQLSGRKRDDDTVERAPAAMRLQEVQKAEPFVRVLL